MRVSKETKVTKGVSLEAQEERIRAYCQMQNLELARVIVEDGETGGELLELRPAGAELLQAIEARHAQHVIALKLDRLFRHAIDAHTVANRWRAQGVGLHIIDMGGNAIDTTSAMGYFFFSMTATFAEMERLQIGERTATALAHKRAHDRAYSPTPYGKRRQGAKSPWGRDGAAELQPHAFELGVLEQLQAWHAQGWSHRAIARELNERKIPTKRGGRQWYAGTVHRILSNQQQQKKPRLAPGQ